MTTGLTDSLQAYELPNRGPGAWVYYGSRVEWTGADRPQALKFPEQPGRKYRRKYIRETIRAEGHTTYRDVVVPLKWKGDFSAAELADRDTWLANHPYAKTWESRGLGTLDITQRLWSDGSSWGSWAGTISNAGAMPPEPSDCWTSDDDYKLLDKLQQRVNGSSFNLASFLGAEGKDTVHFLLDTSNRLYRAIIAVKRGSFDRALAILRTEYVKREQTKRGIVVRTGNRVARKMAREEKTLQLGLYKDYVAELRLALAGDKRPVGKDLDVFANIARITANQWLEFHLAAEPLLGDVQSAAEQLAHRLNVPQKKAYSAKRKRESSLSGKTQGGTSPTYGWFWQVCTTRHSQHIKYIVKEPPSIPQLLGLYNPEVVIWNALPLSFVADYFLPIGQWLEARMLSQMLEGEFVTSTKIQTEAYGLSWRNDINVNPLLYSEWRPGANFLNRGSFTRTVSSGLPVPAPRYRGLESLKSWQRAATVASLIVGSVTGSLQGRHLR